MSIIIGHEVKGYLNPLNLLGWKWLDNEHMFLENLRIRSSTYLP